MSQKGGFKMLKKLIVLLLFLSIHLFAADGADNIHDLPRVMRLAGFHHNKKDAFKSRICHIGEHYTAATVVTWVESLPKPIEQQVQHTHCKTITAFQF